MTIEDLKSLMDNFDPAKLLPDLESLAGNLAALLRIAVMVGPVVLLVIGLLYLCASPKEANYHFGYRCYFGMGSVEAWRFTQRLAGMVWGGLGLILTVVMLVLSGGFAGMETVDMVWRAAKCVAWQAGCTVVSVIAVNTVVAMNFDSKGAYRRKND